MPELFADLAEGASAVRQFFPDPPDADSLRSCAASVQARSIQRAELCNLLLKQAEWFACGERSIAAIRKFHSPKTVAIVASLHPGLFGGTLDGWLKLCTAARLAAWLEEDGIPAVPVCWMDTAAGAAGQRVMILSSSGLRRYELNPSANGEAATSRRVESLLDQIACASGLVAAESDLLMLLKTAYLPDGDLRRGCGRTLAKLLGITGVVLFDPSQPGMDSLVANLPRHVRGGALEEARAQREASLRAAGYVPAVARPSPAHGQEDSRSFTETLHPGPLLSRCLLMPIAAAVVDELEIYDFAAHQPFFSALGLDAPLVWPRVSGTILDLRSRKLLARYELQLKDLFDGVGPVAARLMRRLAAFDVSGRLHSLRAELDQQLDELADPVAATDRLRGRIEDSRRRMRYQIEKLENRFCAARQSREAAILRQVSRLCDNLAPGGRLQEREYAGIQFVLRHSLRVPQILYESIDPWKFTHQFIPLD